MVWRIFVACLCQKLAACCWGLLMDCSSHPQRIPLCRYYTLFQIREVMAKWEQPIGCTTEGVPYRGTTTVLYLLHAADTQYIVVEHFPVLFSHLDGTRCSKSADMLSPFFCSGQTYRVSQKKCPTLGSKTTFCNTIVLHNVVFLPRVGNFFRNTL